MSQLQESAGQALGEKAGPSLSEELPPPASHRALVVGAGLAGCEAAWQLANRGVSVTLAEMKPQKYSPAHHSPGFAELVCSNSLKAARLGSAAGLLKEEMARLGSLVVPCARATAVAAGGALAVDRDRFSALVTEKIRAHPNIRVECREVIDPLAESGRWDALLLASGPLTSDGLARSIRAITGRDTLSFYDAAAPIVSLDSLRMDAVFYAARYGRGEDDYINCPMDREQYARFHAALVEAESAPLKSFDRPDGSFAVYEGCMPIEVLAKRGEDAIRFGPLKPVGLRDPRTGHRPWAVVQLRRENAAGTLYNLVGFQTNLKFGEQKRVFSMIPGLEQAEFVRYGVMHRNTFLDSPQILLGGSRLKGSDKPLYFAGQITGVEGYIESAASGILAGIQAWRELKGKEPLVLPQTTMLGALMGYLSDAAVEKFQPMGSNMGILPPMETADGRRIRDKQQRYELLARRALDDLEGCISRSPADFLPFPPFPLSPDGSL